MPFVLGPNPILARHNEPRSLLVLYNSKAAFLSSLLATRNWERVEVFFLSPVLHESWPSAADQIFEPLRDENRPHPGNRTEREETGLLSPTKSWLGSNLAVLGLKLGWTGCWTRASCWAEVGRKAIQMDPKLKKCTWKSKSRPKWRTWEPLATASHHVGPNGDTTWGTLLQTKRHR